MNMDIPAHSEVPARAVQLSPESLLSICAAYETDQPQVILDTVDEVMSFEWTRAALRGARKVDDPAISPSQAILLARMNLQGVFAQQILEQYEAVRFSHTTLAQRTLDAAVSERISFATVAEFGSELPRGTQLEDLITDTAGLLAGTIGKANKAYYYQEAMTYGTEVISAQLIRDVLSGYFLRFRDKNEIGQLNQENDALYENTRFLQKYQIKPALVRGAGAGKINDWMVLDTGQIASDINAVAGINIATDDMDVNVLARLYGTSSEFVSSAPIYEKHGPDSKEGGFMRLNFNKAIKGRSGQRIAVPELGVQLSSNGHLVGMRGTSVASFAEALGMRDQYELLRGEILAIYCDLVLPAHMINQANREERTVLRERHGKPRAVDTIRRLVLARTRLIEADQAVVEKEFKKENRKSPDEYSVIGFIRALPKGHRAGFEARQMCRKYLGKELASEGETFVVPHVRGGHDLERQDTMLSKGHRAIRRNVGGAIVASQAELEFGK